MSDSSQLTSGLEQVLASIPDPTFALRLRKVYETAAQTIDALADMDLVKYESTSIEGAPDLSLWEEMAPVIRDTVVDVNRLLTVVREEFPAGGNGSLAESIRDALEQAGPLPPGSGALRKLGESERVLQAVAHQIAQQVTLLGERMRSPQVVSDRWNLLADLQSFRSRFREMAGDLVYLSASAFLDLSRAEVVPGFVQDLRTAVAVRAAVADLARVIAARADAANEAEAEDVQWHAQHIERDLDAFGRTQSYRALRAQDKRSIIEFRHELRQIAASPNASKRELLSQLGPFVEFTSSLQRVNKREILVAHDREIWAGCGVKLEQADMFLQSDPMRAAAALAEAIDHAMGLYGRDPGLDVFLRKARKGDVRSLRGAELERMLNTLRELLAGLPMV